MLNKAVAKTKDERNYIVLGISMLDSALRVSINSRQKISPFTRF